MSCNKKVMKYAADHMRDDIGLKYRIVLTGSMDNMAFKASVGWCMRMMTRVGLMLQHRTALVQCLPAEELISFQCHVINLRKQHTVIICLSRSVMQIRCPYIWTCAGSDGSMSAFGSAGPGFDPQWGSKFSTENFQPLG